MKEHTKTVKSDQRHPSDYEGLYGFSVRKDTDGSESRQWKEVTIDDAIQELYRKSVSIQANGIINLKTTYMPAVYDAKGAMISSAGAVASGMAIRKD